MLLKKSHPRPSTGAPNCPADTSEPSHFSRPASQTRIFQQPRQDDNESSAIPGRRQAPHRSVSKVSKKPKQRRCPPKAAAKAACPTGADAVRHRGYDGKGLPSRPTLCGACRQGCIWRRTESARTRPETTPPRRGRHRLPESTTRTQVYIHKTPDILNLHKMP